VTLAFVGINLHQLFVPRAAPALRMPVRAYMLVISVMVYCAVAAAAVADDRWIIYGAVTFYVSDLAVATNKFLDPHVVHRLWGLPTYYVAQIIIATTIAGPAGNF
jgi:uncharacterized membrane protein YhhN